MDRVHVIIGLSVGHNPSIGVDLHKIGQLINDAKRLPEAVPLMRRALFIATAGVSLASFAAEPAPAALPKRERPTTYFSSIPTGGPSPTRSLDTASSVSLVCEPGAFDIEPRSQEVQLVKRDGLKGTALHQDDFAKWKWLVTPRETGKHTLLVKVSAAMKDSRGLPTTASLPDKIIAVTVRVHLVRATVGAVRHAAPGLAWAIVTALLGVFTKDYWWPALRGWLGIG